jgi:hypothetical protein
MKTNHLDGFLTGIRGDDLTARDARRIRGGSRTTASDYSRPEALQFKLNALNRTREPERVYRGESPAAGTHRADAAICEVSGGRKARQEVESGGPGSWHLYGCVRGQCRNGRAGLPRIRRGGAFSTLGDRAALEIRAMDLGETVERREAMDRGHRYRGGLSRSCNDVGEIPGRCSPRITRPLLTQPCEGRG